MGLRQFNTNFIRYSTEPRVSTNVIVAQMPYCGYEDRWYMDVELVDMNDILSIHGELESTLKADPFVGDVCSTIKLKLPVMKGVNTWTTTGSRSMRDVRIGDCVNIDIKCAGTFKTRSGIWVPSRKLVNLCTDILSLSHTDRPV